MRAKACKNPSKLQVLQRKVRKIRNQSKCFLPRLARTELTATSGLDIYQRFNQLSNEASGELGQFFKVI